MFFDNGMFSKQANLFMTLDRGKRNYMAIKNISRLVKSSNVTHAGADHFCMIFKMVSAQHQQEKSTIFIAVAVVT